MVVDAYNAMGYTALAIGNHDFEFGAGRSPGRRNRARPAGALKAAAARARFPFLAANILDATTGQRVDWPNVRPSAIVDAAGIRVGLIGVMTYTGLTPDAGGERGLAGHARRWSRRSPPRRTPCGGKAPTSWCWWPMPAGAAKTPPIPATCPRAIRAARSSTWCGDCRAARCRRSWPATRTAAWRTCSRTCRLRRCQRAASSSARMDLTIDTATRRVAGVRVFPPRNICTREKPSTGDCQAAGNGVPVEYEGGTVQASAAVESAMTPALAEVRRRGCEPLGVTVSAPIERIGTPESPLGNLFADAIRAATPGAEVAISYGGGRGGLRADLAAGPLTVRRPLRRVPVRQPGRARATDRQPAGARARRAARQRAAARPDQRLGPARHRALCGDRAPRHDRARLGRAHSRRRDAGGCVNGQFVRARRLGRQRRRRGRGDDRERAASARDGGGMAARRGEGQIAPADFYDATAPRWSVPPEGITCGA